MIDEQNFLMEPGGRGVPPLLVVISGPSGVGKDVVIERLKARSKFHQAVTATTRPRRDYETEGVHYYFKTVEEFQAMIQQGELLENATVYNNYYGPPISPLRDALARNEDVILRIDVQGAAHVKRKIPDAVFIFIAPGSFEELTARLLGRGTETPDALAVRLATYEQEMKAAASFDYLVINRDNELDATVDAVLSIVVAEKNRVSPRRVRL
jgi:guanylate kinase